MKALVPLAAAWCSFFLVAVTGFLLGVGTVSDLLVGSVFIGIVTGVATVIMVYAESW